jgi:hypothetical protein
MFVPNEDALIIITQVEFKELHAIHWGIECYHRAIKQVCGIERFMVRTTEDLSDSDLNEANLSAVNFSGVNLSGSDFA